MAKMNDMDGTKTAFKDNHILKQLTAGRFDLEVDHVHFQWYGSSDFKIFVGKTGSLFVAKRIFVKRYISLEFFTDLNSHI